MSKKTIQLENETIIGKKSTNINSKEDDILLIESAKKKNAYEQKNLDSNFIGFNINNNASLEEIENKKCNELNYYNQNYFDKNEYKIIDGTIYKNDISYELKECIKVFNFSHISKEDELNEEEEEYNNLYEKANFIKVEDFDSKDNQQNTYLNKKRKQSQNISQNDLNQNKKKQKKEKTDYYVKRILTNILNNYALNNVNKLIKKCGFYPKLKLHKCNYKKYAGNTKEEDIHSLLKKIVKKVFIDYDIKEKEGIINQIKNNIKIDKIYNIENFPNSEEQKALKKFLESTIEEIIIMYYKSEVFEKFKNNEKNKKSDIIFMKKRNRNISLLEENGFIKYANYPPYMHNERKEKINFIH